MIEIEQPKFETVTLNVIGTAPLICHRWSEKAKKEMRDKQMKKKKAAKKPKNPKQDYQDSLYQMPDDSGGFGFPAVAFKCAAIRAASSLDITMVQARQMFHVRTDAGDLVRIYGEPRMREDMVRLNGKTADIRYRGEFAEWHAKVEIQFNAGLISAEQVCHLFSLAGFSVGIGEWRPERNGSFGTFRIELDE